MTLYEKIKLMKIEKMVMKIEKMATLFSVAWNRAAIDNNMAQAIKLLGDQAGRTLDTITRTDKPTMKSRTEE